MPTSPSSHPVYVGEMCAYEIRNTQVFDNDAIVPLMTAPAPNVTVKGPRPAMRDESNTCPLD